MQRYRENYSIGFYKTRNRHVSYQLGLYSDALRPAYRLGLGGLVRLQVKIGGRGARLGIPAFFFYSNISNRKIYGTLTLLFLQKK